jgi:hypothetical protein
VVRTYAQLQPFVAAFAQGHLNLLILAGRAGLAKSQLLRQSVGDRACWLEGNATAFGMYCALYAHRDQLVVIDDVDSLYASPAALRLLKCLCQTDRVKRVAWQSAAAQLERADIPRAFPTTSRVAILANDWRTLNANVAAVQDQGFSTRRNCRSSFLKTSPCQLPTSNCPLIKGRPRVVDAFQERTVQQAAWVLMGLQQHFHAPAQD